MLVYADYYGLEPCESGSVVRLNSDVLCCSNLVQSATRMCMLGLYTIASSRLDLALYDLENFQLQMGYHRIHLRTHVVWFRYEHLPSAVKSGSIESYVDDT